MLAGSKHADRQAIIITGRLTGIHANRQAGRQAGRQEAHRMPWVPEIQKLGRGGNMWVSQTCWQAGSRHADRQAIIITGRQAGIHADRQTGRQTGGPQKALGPRKP
jgi:hypothetical protein